MAKAKVLLTAGALLAGLAVAATGVVAKEDVIKERKAQMKEIVLPGHKAANAIIKKGAAFDAKMVANEMASMARVAASFTKYFPKGSETGGKTTAAPKIWTDMADFKAKFVKFEADLKAAGAATAKGKDAFVAAYGAVAKNCGGCHKVYRIKKKK